MKFHGNIITEQGVKFGVIIVKPHVTKSPTTAARMQELGQRAWGQLPIVLIGEDGQHLRPQRHRPLHGECAPQTDTNAGVEHR